MADKPLKVAEAAEIANVPRSTLYNWIRRGEIETERAPGGRLRVRESEARRLKAWLEGEDVEPSRMPRD